MISKLSRAGFNARVNGIVLPDTEVVNRDDCDDVRGPQVIVPSAVRELGAELFEGCVGLQNLTFCEGSRLEKIGSDCFRGSGLVEITTPATVRCICSGAFHGCKSLKRVELNEGLEVLGECAQLFSSGVFRDSAVHSVKLPSTLKKIGDYSFCNCKNLRAIALPEHLETIGDYSFRGTALTEVFIPMCVKTIGEGAFNGCW